MKNNYVISVDLGLPFLKFNARASRRVHMAQVNEYRLKNTILSSSNKQKKVKNTIIFKIVWLRLLT